MDKWMQEGYTLSGTTSPGVYIAKRGSRYGILVTRWDGVLILSEDTFYYSQREVLEAVESLAFV